MTKVMFKSGNGRYYIRAEGHATGSRTVCSAISGLLYALAGWLLNTERGTSAAKAVSLPLEGKDLEEEPRIQMCDGFTLIEFSGREEAEAVYMMTLIGLLQIEAKHPEYIRINEEKQTGSSI